MKNPTIAKRNSAVGRFLKTAMLLLLATALSLPGRLQAQDDIGSLYDKAMGAMQESKWAEALTALDEIIQRYGDSALEDFGPRFGGIYFVRGDAHFNNKSYEKAAEDFKICYEQYGNKVDTEAPKRNPYWKVSAFRWAAAEQYNGRYQEAIGLFQKFLDSKPEKGTYSEAALYLSMGICNAKIGKLQDARSWIERAFSNADKLGANSRQLMHGFRALAEAWVAAGAKEEGTANRFLDKNGNMINLSPYSLASAGLDKALLKLGADAASGGMHTFALRLFGMVPKTSDVVQELRERAANYPKIPKKLQDEINTYQSIIDGGDPLEIRTLAQVATTYDALGNQRAGYVIYDYLSTNYPKTTLRPDLLYGAALMASKAGELLATQWYGTIFLEEFPDHERRKDVARLMLGHLFQQGAYEEALELALEVRQPMPEGSPERDLADFVVGGSLHFLARFEEAEPELNNHVATYPKSEFIESSLYFQASNMIKLLKWAPAKEKLEAFLEKFPDSEFLDVAYYDLANAHFALDAYSESLKLIELLKSDYPDSQVLDSALMLEGDIANFQENYPRATEAYLAAKDLAVADGDEDTRANALSQLVGVSISAEKVEDAVAYYDEFIKDFQGTYYEPVTVVTAMPALVKVNRADEGLEKLEAMILNLGNDPASENLEKTVNTYAKFYSDLKDPVTLIERLRDMEKKVPDNIPLIAWLTIARIEILDDQANKDKFDRKDAQIAVAFQQLQDIPKEQLANYIKIKIATNLTDNDKEGQAEPWLQSVIDGASPEFKDHATLGLARVKAKSKDPTKRAAAKAMFERVISDYQTPELTEQARLGLGRMYFESNEYRKAIDEGFLTYMENKGWSKARAEVTFKIGRCYEEISDFPNALFAYMGVVANYRGQLNYSAEAWYRAANIQYKQGKKQDAFDLINDMCLRMSVHAGNELDTGNFIRKALTTRDDWASELGINLQELNSAVTE